MLVLQGPVTVSKADKIFYGLMHSWHIDGVIVLNYPGKSFSGELAQRDDVLLASRC